MLFSLTAVIYCVLLPSSLSTYINDDCIARRQRTITSPWGNFQLTVWNPPEGEASEPLLTLMADFYGTDLPDDYTRVLVFREKIEVDVTSSESRSLTFVNISRILPEGWLEFRVELSQRLQIFAPGFNHPLLDIKNQMTVEQLFIEGSNITVNCKDPFAWEVKGEAESVPLASTGWYNLTILSRSPVFPVLSLGSKDFDLGWDGNAVASRTSHGLPLPAFTKHHISVKCEASELIVECSLMEGNTDEAIDTVYLPDMIHFFTIEGNARDSFLIFVDSQHEQIQDVKTSTRKITFEYWGLISVTAILLIVISAYSIKKGKKYCSGKNKRSRSRQFTGGNFVLIEDLVNSGKTFYFVESGKRPTKLSKLGNEKGNAGN
ncbi:uncharacterized protein LOC119586213 isoform X2 [Penaeus monodon]|uniref:uncharacterized protein LOC119586213 isoform X2 n=1 Tax=Penaeus monodon TaxID=6687 RepID=UPI0018A7D242|nr:uncharacterized protein LOC119586213 isoform X2 [Penaeus monodon]